MSDKFVLPMGKKVKKSEKKQVSFSVNPEEFKQLEALAQKHFLSRSDVARLAYKWSIGRI